MSINTKLLAIVASLALPVLAFATTDTMEVHVTVSEINEITLPDSIDLDLTGATAGGQPVSDIGSGSYSVTINDASESPKKIVVAAEPSDVDEFQFANITLLLNMEVPTGSGGSAITDLELTSAAAEGYVSQDAVIGITNSTASTQTLSVTAQGPTVGSEVPTVGFYEMTLTFQIIDQED